MNTTTAKPWMHPARQRRLAAILVLVAGIALAAYFALKAFNENLMYFFSPSDVVNGKAPRDAVFRLGGMVVEGSVERPEDSLTVRFALTDFQHSITVEYTGILPDLFREGQGIVAKGQLNAESVFVAEEVLAKHDENYMPPEVAGSLQAPSPQP